MKNKIAAQNLVTPRIDDKILKENDFTKNEKKSKNLTTSANEDNFLYRHKKFDLLENTILESDEIRSSKSETFSNGDEFSGIDIPVGDVEQAEGNIVSNELKEEPLDANVTSTPSPSNDDVEDKETNDKGWILDIDDSREICRTASSSDFKTFPDPVRIEFDYASTLPRLNTVANFEDKSIVIHNKDTTAPTFSSSDYETDLENSSVKFQDSKTDKDVMPAKGAPYYFSTVKANFRDKKLVSYIPRPTLRDTSRDIRVESVRKNVHTEEERKNELKRIKQEESVRKNVHIEEERKNELKRIKQEELKICNTNLG